MENPTHTHSTLGTQKDLIARLKTSGKSFILDPDEEFTDDYAHFFFLGIHDGQEVVFDTILYTLRMQHESELFEIAEEQTLRQFPQYKVSSDEKEEAENTQHELEEEIGLYMAEVMLGLEEEGEIKVKEHVDLDLQHEFGIGLDAGLHIDKVTTDLIESFIRDFNADKLELDPGYYSFQTQTDSLNP